MNDVLWWFWQNSLAALLMILCVMLACRLFRHRPAVQHLLWLVMLLKFVAPPIVGWPYWSLAQSAANPPQSGKVQGTSFNVVDGFESKANSGDPVREAYLALWREVPPIDSQNVRSHFEGTVLDPDGKPLQGAEVFVISDWNETIGLGPVRAESNADGKFSFDAADMTWQSLGKTLRRGGLIVAKKRGFVPEWMETWGDSRSIVSLRNGLWGPTKNTPIELQLARVGVPIRGQLLSADDNPLAGARVRLTQLMIPRNRDLTAFLDYWSKAPTTATFLTGISYKRGLSSHFELLPVESEWVTDAEGQFELHGVGSDRLVQLEISAPNFITATISAVTRDTENVGILLDGFDGKGKPTQTLYGANFKFKLQPALTISGIVRDRDSQQPITGMWVKRGGYDPLTSPEKAKDMAVTDTTGRFSITGLDPKLLTYKAEHRGVSAIPQPGTQYVRANATIENDAEMNIECVRGINYRLKVVDESGQAVDATVEYVPINPNEVNGDSISPVSSAINHAARRADGTYEGFVVPGPGAILVTTPSRIYRPTFVDPKAFFAPGQTWDENSNHIYGTYNTLAGLGVWYDQRKYAAIVLVNPAKDAGPMQLSAKLVRDSPRDVSLVDTDGKPVNGAMALFHQWAGTSDSRTEAIAATFPVFGLATNRDQEITFSHSERKLIGHVTASGRDDVALTVTMQPWATITGRFVDASGEPIALSKRGQGFKVTDDSVDGSWSFRTTTDKGANFRLERLVPGHGYSFNGVYLRRGDLTPLDVFRDLELSPGEVRDLGDIVVQTQPD